MQCINPIRLQMKGKNLQKYPDGLKVPCGKCLACHIKQKEEWSMRVLHELYSHSDYSFITLTYADDSLPVNATLRKDHLQKFFKRLRSDLKRHKFDIKLKYFACGEYGTLNNRPHYHIILYGLGLNDYHKQIIMDNWPYCDWTQPSIKKGAFGLVENASIRYVAKYIHSKYNGEKEKEVYKKTGRISPFRLLSQGIGENYCYTLKDKIIRDGYITMSGKKVSIPRYYLKKLELNDDVIENIKKNAEYKSAEYTEKLTGINIDENIMYKNLSAEINLVDYYKKVNRHREVYKNTMTAKINLHKQYEKNL